MVRKPTQRGLFGQPVRDAKDTETVRVAQLALRLARRHMADYSHPKSPRKFTQPQLFACLVLKAHLGLTYRRTEEMLVLMPAVREALGIVEIPRFTTLQEFADRASIGALVDGVLRSVGRSFAKGAPQDAALDGTGLETTSASAHFTSRAGRKRTKYVKLMLGVLCAAVAPCALAVAWGPSHDLRQAWEVRDKLLEACRPTMLWGDSAFDCEEWHRSGWEDLRAPTYAPTVVRTEDGHVNGFYRQIFTAPVKEYGRRWMCESVNSAIKRTTGSTLRSRKESTLFAEAALKVAAYAIKV